ncbi:MAG: sulfatase [Oligoflexia bacterium]|nr:MAG: sulfatase [Oligoflexia bacterium]
MIVWWAFFISFAGYSLSRGVFLAWNFGQFPNHNTADFLFAFLNGLRFDLFAILTVGLVPALVWWVGSWFIKDQKKWNRLFLGIYLVPQTLFLFSNLVEVEFSNFTGRRLTIDALFNFREIQGGNFIGMFTQYWPLAICSFAIPTLAVWITWKYRALAESEEALPKWKRWTGFGLSLILMVVGVRGGFQTKPLSFAHAQVFQDQKLNLMILNSTFTFIKSYGKEGLPQENWMPEKEMLSLLRSPEFSSKFDLPDGPRNVMIIILESFSLEHMGRVNGDQGFTPFLDELGEKGIFFTHAFAGGRRSIEGISSIMAGIPVLMPEPYLSSPFANNQIEAIGNVLKKHNYHTSFFHGGKNGTMFFDQFTRTAGIDHYYGESQYPNKNDHDGSWGIYDEPFMSWMVDQMNTFPKPFFTTLFTLSSHHPFKVPPQYQGKFPKGPSEIHESIGYADYSLRKFFEKASQQSWFQNTLFILTADHAFKNWRPEYNTELGMYRVPLIFYHPQMKWAGQKSSKVVQHIDIPNSIYDFLKIKPTKINLLGHSVFSDEPGRAVMNMDERYWLIEGDYFIQAMKSGDVKLYSLNDLGQKNPLQDETQIQKLSRKLQAIRQYYSEGLWRNKLFR